MYTDSDMEKLGNTVVYVANKVPRLRKTKLLKLLYLMEEYSVRHFHTPFLGLPFEVWQAGPVVKDVFIDLSETPSILKGFVEKKVENGRTYVYAVKDFSDDEFSDNDMVVMDDVLEKYGGYTASQLVNKTHERGSLWYRTAERNGLLDVFRHNLSNNSDCRIDLGEELSGCARDFYNEQMVFLDLSRSYSSKIRQL